MRFSNGKRHRETRQSCAFFQHVSGMFGTECGQYPVQNCNSSQLLQIDQLQIYTGQHPFYYKVSAAQNGREGVQFTQDRLKAGSRDLSETSKSSSVSVNAAGFCACERSAVFVALRCTSGAGANRNQQWGTGNQGRGQKSEWHICSKPAPRCKGRTASRWRACNPPNTHPPPQTPQTVCRGAVYPSRRKKTGTVRRKPAIPPTRRPPSIRTEKLRKVYAVGKERVVALNDVDLAIEKGEFCCKVALCVRRGS